MRTEHDLLGEVTVEESRYWGAHTQRALIHFTMGVERWPSAFIHAFGWQKWAAARANETLLPKNMTPVIVQACQEVAQGQWDDHFPLSLWQSGSGTQIHMNVNEVIAHRANGLGASLFKGVKVHPNDHVNCGQSSNDTVPTVMHITLVHEIHTHLLPALHQMEQSILRQSYAWKDIQKVGRTHLQDGLCITLGEEFGAFAHQLHTCLEALEARLPSLYELAQGGTVMGNGMNTHPQFKARFFSFLSEVLPYPFVPTRNSFAAQSAHDALVSLSGDLNGLACILAKIAQDVRWMISGPRCGLLELTQPWNELGSSMIPGKINPSQAEVLTMIAIQVMGLHHATTLGGLGQFQLNTAKPLIFYNLWTSLTLLADTMGSFTQHFLDSLQPKEEALKRQCSHNLSDLTRFVPQLGYDKVGTMILQAQKENLTLSEVLALHGLSLDGGSQST